MTLRFLGVEWRLDRGPRICAVVNVTPDSFSDGGHLKDVESAVEFALRSIEAGAEMVDVGGESTRPRGATPVSPAEEIRRVAPVIAALARRTDVPIAVDTSKATVAAAAIDAGAKLVNDISGGSIDPGMVSVVDGSGAAFVLGHARGRSLAEIHAGEASPPTYAEVRDELHASLAALPAALRARTIVDPGLGFGKKGRENLELLARAGELRDALGRPVMVGPSRKRFLGELVGREVGERDDATVGACLAAAAAGAAFLRVHDVRRVRDALVVFEAARAAAPAAPPGSRG